MVLSISIFGQILKVRELPDLKVFLLTLRFFQKKIAKNLKVSKKTLRSGSSLTLRFFC